MKEDRLQRADEREEDSGQFSSLPPFSPEQGPTNSVRLNNLDLFTIATTASNTPNCLHITLSWYDTINSWVKLTPLDGRPDSSSPFLGWDWEISWAAAWRSSCRRASVSPGPGILWFLFLAEPWECNKLDLSVKRETGRQTWHQALQRMQLRAPRAILLPLWLPILFARWGRTLHLEIALVLT